MNQDEIIAMAKEAGMEVHERKGQIRIGSAVLTGADSTNEVTRFAALVAAKEREKCAQVCESMRTVPPNGEPEDVERGFNAALRRSAAAIRARGQKGGA